MLSRYSTRWGTLQLVHSGDNVPIIEEHVVAKIDDNIDSSTRSSSISSNNRISSYNSSSDIKKKLKRDCSSAHLFFVPVFNALLEATSL